ncbi:anti-sigma factor family protein [Actinacidiphila sp. ITFR-21]|uniref:anti-sigma factor family protein n=1 Tax=Actinacidiphila sp. ITFR-21 TaxID=3075199 RepID=UPI002889290E|nr:zf-HC2 domain-containing protein [Streptomyces sp. ITFR-21]WNI17853.1 zf-HC2 domain-containing protein [Streptomyces sp. ITFR-21]
MSSSGSGEHRPHRPGPAEQHLGDRLAAFVDGELTDDSRDRVLAHLATCTQCKAAAAEQRRLKSVVAASELPAISAGLLARLQGLPGMGTAENPGRGGPWDPPAGPGNHDTSARLPGPALGEEPAGPFDGGLLGSGPLGSGPLGSGRFSYLGPARDLLAPAGSRSRGFRIHQPAAEPHPAADPVAVAPRHRSRRFAFAAAGAFSMAAIAIGGALPMEAAVDGGARPDDGPAVSPLTAGSVSDTRGVTPRGVLGAVDERLTRAPAAARSVTSAASVSLTRPLLPPGAVPLVTAVAAEPPRSSVVLR